MNISKFLIALIVLSMVTAGAYGLYISVAEEQNLDTATSSTYAAKYNKLSEISKPINSSYSDVMGVGAKTDSTIVQFFTGVWDAYNNAKKLISAVFTIPKDMINDLATDLGMEGWVQIAVWSLIVVALVAGIIAILIGREW